MLGKKITGHWSFNIWNLFWFFITPSILILGSVLSLINSQETKRDSHQYPYWTLILGNLISVSTLSGVVLWALYGIVDVLFINKRVILCKIYFLKKPDLIKNSFSHLKVCLCQIADGSL